MRYRSIIYFTFMFLLSGSSCDVNTSDSQVSKDLLAAKKSGFLVNEYSVEKSIDSDIYIGEAWVEKTWYNEIHIFEVKKVHKYGDYQLCFKIKQKGVLIDKADQVYVLGIIYPKTKTHVGVNGGVYFLSLHKDLVPDTIILNVVERCYKKSELTDTKTGTLTFTAILK